MSKTKIINGRKMFLFNTFPNLSTLEIHITNIISNHGNVWISRILDKDSITIGYEVWVKE